GVFAAKRNRQERSKLSCLPIFYRLSRNEVDPRGCRLCHPSSQSDHVEDGVGLTGQAIESRSCYCAEHCYLPAVVLPYEEGYMWVVHVTRLKLTLDLFSELVLG